MLRIQNAGYGAGSCRRTGAAADLESTGFGRFEPVPIEQGGTRAGRLRFCPGHHPCFGARRGYNPWGTFEIVKLPRQ
jgi:hypothetical protein